MRLFSNERETFEVVDSDEKTVIVIHSLWEALHFAGVALGLRRVFRQRGDVLPEPAKEMEEKMVEDKPVVMKYGPLKVRVA
ncbi:MAG: hypothetical protein SVU32_02675 [Candidatus Nanohaloarchaea archaeon]|nr:hypothetical protein [Candidatus Nanohaloarchaea archaeon]